MKDYHSSTLLEDEGEVCAKKAILITGASGEIGAGPDQGAVSKAERDDRHPGPAAPFRRRSSRLVIRMQGDILDKALLARLVSEYEIGRDLPPGGAALDPQRVHPRDGPPGQRGGHAGPAAAGRRAVAVARRAGAVHLPQLDRGLRACPTWRRRPPMPAVREWEWNYPAHDVRLQQAVLRAAGHLLQPVLPPAGR